MEIKHVSTDNFNTESMNDFRRHQVVKNVYRLAEKHGAETLYISACSAQETIGFYLAMGCKVSTEPIPAYAEAEPFDIQMECEL